MNRCNTGFGIVVSRIGAIFVTRFMNREVASYGEKYMAYKAYRIRLSSLYYLRNEGDLGTR